MNLNKEQQKVINKINGLLEKSFEDNGSLMSRDDKKMHVSIAVLDILRLTVKNDIIMDGGNKFCDVIYKLGGSEILSRTINNDKSKLDQVHEDVIYE